MNNKKGSAMVEASILYPLIIGAVMAVIYIMICMYTGAAIKANLDAELRNKAMEITSIGERMTVKHSFNPQDKYGKKAFLEKISFTEEFHVHMKCLSAHAFHSYRGNSMMPKNLARQHQGTVYMIDEREYIRKADMIVQ
ncbi:hypothetical protein [Aminipila luticellarii]|uniref:Uncharacterized protein n=1 Tax=Aminipila luticellarii TaxID=2507160 RepID=A0A410PUY4_9FIRM|nr:hypothetical protein [Aminipila luticellarii]QAT42720.1 hypothetical protein EQM06_05460 [Aminipila luticellarii]